MTGLETNHNKMALLALIFAGEAIFLLPFVLARVFRPTILIFFDVSNLELGSYFSVYGIVAMGSYFFGGPLADRFPARNLMSAALWLTALGGLIMIFFRDGATLGYLYGYWGFTTIFLFWAALIKATRAWGGAQHQGLAFGLLEGGRGLTAALIATFSLTLFALMMSLEGGLLTQRREDSFTWVILVTCGIVFIAGWMVWIFVPCERSVNSLSKYTSLSDVRKLLNQPTVWMQGVIVVCAYVGYKITDDYSLYANEVLGFSEVDSAVVGTSTVWLRPIFAIVAGWLADRFDGIRIIVIAFLLVVFGGLIIYSGFLDHIVWMILLILAITVAGVYGIRGIYFAMMGRTGIPMQATGAAVGIMSFLGFTPDIFMSPWMGYLLDTYPGRLGHEYVFLVLSCFAMIGFIISLSFSMVSKKKPININ